MNAQFERYPANLLIGRNDFSKCDWRDALGTSERDGYHSMWTDFSEVARRELDNGNQKQSKIFWLLADACSMMLRPESTNQPFRAFVEFTDGRSVVPSDLLNADICFFAVIVDDIDEPLLKARLADLVWLMSSKRDHRFALLAIDAYRRVPLDTETWMRDGEHCWARAISLSHLLKAGAGDRLNEIRNSVVAAIKKATNADGFLALWLAELLAKYNLGETNALEIAQQLELIAQAFSGEDDSLRRRRYLKCAAQWYGRAGDDKKSSSMLVAVAESYATEAKSKTSLGTPIHALAASLYEDAIQAYRTIPKRHRADNSVDERILELQVALRNCGEVAIEEFAPFDVPPVDMSDVVRNSRDAVAGKSASDALHAFATLHQLVNVKALREQTLKSLNTYVLSSMFSSTLFGRDGRVIAKRPAFRSGDSQVDEKTILAKMVQDHQIFINMIVQGSIIPALQVIHLEHRFNEQDFVQLANGSPVVPHDRAHLFGKALYAGFDGDFAVALYILTAQLENLVRFHLKRARVITTNLDQDGIENEKGLSTLMELPDANRVLGDSLAFEIRALFCDAFGPNLRNSVAHGLLDDYESASIYSIYAWWFVFRLVNTSFWQHERSAASAA